MAVKASPSGDAEKKKTFSLGGVDRKKLEFLAAIVIIAVMLLVYFSSFSSNTSASGGVSMPTTSTSFDAEREEARLKSVLSAIKGAGEVEVMITFDGSAEMIPAYDSDTTSSSTDETDADSSRTTRSDNETQKPSSNNSGTIVVAEKRPDVLGVIVIAQGADDISVRMQLVDAVQTALDVAPSKVGVYVMK